MADAWVEVGELKRRLEGFFHASTKELNRFGSTVNQTFEAFVFAQVVAWFQARPEWTIALVNPKDHDGKEMFRLKFSTRGRPGGYSFVRCTSSDGNVVQVRHQLRVATKYHREGPGPAANMCLDVAVIRDMDLEGFSTFDHVPNDQLLTFGEAKHMSAFAELVASFIGAVHELQPHRLKRLRTKNWQAKMRTDPAPFLFVSGSFWRTGEGLVLTIKRRKYDVDVFNKAHLLTSGLGLPTSKPVSATP